MIMPEFDQYALMYDTLNLDDTDPDDNVPGPAGQGTHFGADTFAGPGGWWRNFGRRFGRPFRRPYAFGQYPVQFGDDADNAILKAAALDLVATIKRSGVPQGATRSVKFFAQSWNSASADTQLPTDGKYTQGIQAALDAALSSLAPGSGAAPQAVL